MPRNYLKPSPSSWIARKLTRPHPDAFTAGLLEFGRWRFRPSAVDPYRPDGVVTLQHGQRAVRLRVEGVDGAGRRDGHLLVRAISVDTGGPLEISVPAGDVERFGVEA